MDIYNKKVVEIEDRIIRKMIREIIAETVSEMSGFPRVHNMMTGGVDSINTIGMMTSENPMAQQLSPGENKKLFGDLKADLKNLNLGFIPIEGHYGYKENALVIPNIKREDLIRLGEKYQQDSVIFGKRESKGEDIFIKWEFLQRGKVGDTVYATITNSGDLNTRDDLFSTIKGRQFIIPFFDEKERYSKPSKEYSIQKKNINKKANI